ncbi:MAG: hypothetical protein ABEI98_02035 [Halorhabdus sp.]
MRRRTLLAAAGTTVIGGTAGCGALRSQRHLSDPTHRSDGEGRGAIVFARDGEDVGHFGADGSVADGVVPIQTEIWHRDGTTVESVEGDSSPPPEIRLSTPDRAPGTRIDVTDLDDLADETISTLELIVRPWSETATTIAFDVTIGLAGGGLLGADYELDGQLDLSFPALAD